MERYEAYKDSGVEWIGEIPEGWEARRIKTAVKRKGEAGHPDETVLSLYRDYGVVVKDSRDDNFNRTSENTEAYRFVEVDDLVVNKMKAWQGSLAVSGYKGIVSPAYYVYRIIDDSVLPRYMHYQLRDSSYLPEYRRLSGGIRPAQWDLSSDNFVNIPMLVPPLAEQKRIADYLDAKTAEIDALVADCEREAELLREYRKAVISEAVTKGLDPDAPMKDSSIEWIGEIPETWELSRIGWLSTCLNGDRGVNYPSGEDMQDEGVPFIVTDALHGDKVDQSRCKYISNERYELLGGVKLRINDIAYCLRGSVGTCAINTFATAGTVASSLMAIRPITCNPNWLYYVLVSEIVSKQVESYMNGTCAANLSAEGVSRFRIPMPSNGEQVAIADYLDAKTAEIGSLIDAKQTMADKLREYRRSLISEAVTGKFKVPGVE